MRLFRKVYVEWVLTYAPDLSVIYLLFFLVFKVNIQESPITRMASDYTPNELEYFKKIVSSLEFNK